jgi:geranylgeranyl reductase family protein
LIDKAIFPRDKICGDALSGKVMPVLKKLNPDLISQFENDQLRFTPSWGIKFAAPNGKSIDIPFSKNPEKQIHPPGFISRRMDFDQFLVNQIDPAFADFRQGHELYDLKASDEGIRLTIEADGIRYEVQTELLIAAEGERSIAARKLTGFKKEPDHFCAGLRAYYSGVTGMHDKNYIELHFLKELLPGYFWIFPLPGGYANVGAGMLSSSVSKKRVNLRESMLKVIRENETISSRFTNATLHGKIEGWGLPLGSKKRPISGAHFMLLGDAASMIDPFTGEGISNAMYCGMTAANTAAEAIKSGNYSGAFLKSYEDAVYNRLWNELKLSHTMQRLCNYPWLFNYVINKAEKNVTFRDTISCMFDDLDLREKFRQPSFYLKLLFNNK